MFIPIGNENSTVRRLPWVTFIVMALNVLIYYVTLPGQAESMKQVMSAAVEFQKFLGSNEQLLADEEVRSKLIAEGLIRKEEADFLKEQFRRSPRLSEYNLWLRSPEVKELR